MQFSFPPSPCQRLQSRYFPGLQIWVKRDDLLHTQVSGNKFRKLKYALQACSTNTTLVTMGGPWSNHLHATAHAAALGGWRSIGLVRGAAEVTTATLDDCVASGMQLRFLTRDAYRNLRTETEGWQHYVDSALIDSALWLPEGGSAPQALRGVSEVIQEVEAELHFIPDTIVVACGTGATLAGILAGLDGRSQALGIAVLKNATYLHAEIAALLQAAGYPSHQNYELLTDFHQGGYGKAPPELLTFCREFSAESGIPIEPVYTGKVFYALAQMAQAGAFRADQRILVIHTGGLQGARGFAT
ncbi:1-aminocyclopropane-1-carboxylate deaminase/D-cysteine desulfhydrase [Glaciimonas soli]|nr:pyridoxal-phosphate dependent enzyme [Glaciimonas soli]